MIQFIAELDSPRVHRRIRIVAVGKRYGTSRVPIPIAIKALVDDTVAVVVQPVADFDYVRCPIGVAIVAIARAGAVPIAIGVVVVVHRAVAIVVEAIADIHRSRQDQAVRVVTIPRAGRHPIPILIVFIDHTIAVGVDPIAMLLGAWVNGVVGVVAIPTR